jgi:basic membrane lipoprotein Med (substrate-binding protein (PBP1-ABC) superfamily)
VAAYPIPEVQRGINAFTLGCKSRFPGCVVKVRITGTSTFIGEQFARHGSLGLFV